VRAIQFSCDVKDNGSPDKPDDDEQGASGVRTGG